MVTLKKAYETPLIVCVVKATDWLPRRMVDNAPLLELENVTAHYGDFQALFGITLRVMSGEIVTLIGANGAGTTTTLRTISGLLKPKTGEVMYDGRNITGTKPHVITAMGVSHVPEGRGIFANLTVNDNLELGAYLRKDKIKQSEYDRIFTLFPVLKERIKHRSWRFIHWLSWLCFATAALHGFLAGSDAHRLWSEVVTIVCIAVVTASATWRLAMRPERAAGRTAHSPLVVGARDVASPTEKPRGAPAPPRSSPRAKVPPPAAPRDSSSGRRS